jgi:tripartite-type tricarboxylate transporter receptor subunit TctC
MEGARRFMNALRHVNRGRMRALGVTSAKRASAVGDFPAMAQRYDRRKHMQPGMRVLAAALILHLGAGVALAQSYPNKPIRFLVPTAPGGGLDVIARLVSPSLTESLGKAVVVDNRSGASGAIALELTARAAPDGYTLMIFSAGQVVHAALNKTSYDLYRDFAPVSQISAAPYVLVVHPGLPPKTVSELIAYAKSHPGALNYASSGHATLQHLVTEFFGVTVGVKLVHIPYKGVGAAFPDLLSGRTQMTLSSISALAPQIRSKGLRPLAVTSKQRMAMLPEVPTMIEAGIPGFVVTQWHGVLSAAGTPRPVVERLQREIVNALQRPDVTARLANDGTEAVGSSPQQFAAHMKAERERWGKVIERAGIRAEQGT